VKEKMRAKIAIVTCLLWALLASAQSFTGGHDRLIIGGNAGRFRISYEGFSRIYDGRSGMAPGATVLVKIRPPYYVAVKYHQFEKAAEVIDNNTVVDTRKWEERWYNLGVRYVSYGERRMVNHVGFGFAFFKIDESGPGSVFGPQPGKRDASGFFLDAGLEYRFLKYLSIGVELEITSAGLEGKSGFEGSSVGGYLVSLGLNWFVF
jgi:hypothetical protein